MVQSYYLTFGFSKQDKVGLGEIISSKLGIQLETLSRGTLGYRFGPIAETLSILENYVEEEDWWQEEAHQNYPILVTASFTHGKNDDKEKRAGHVRKILQTINDLIEIRFEIIVSEN